MASMCNFSGLPELLEDNQGYFDAPVVGGEFGITAELFPYARIVDYQEKRGIPAQGYYRLCRHPYVRRLEDRVKTHLGAPAAQLVSSYELAEQEATDFQSLSESPLSIHSSRALPDAWPTDADLLVTEVVREDIRAGVILARNPEHGAALFDRCRKRGLVISARDAAWLCGLGDPPPAPAHKRVLDEPQRLEQAASGWLLPSGMAAISATLAALWRPERPHQVVMGHLYSDTHVIFSELPIAQDRDVQTTFLTGNATDQLAAAIRADTFCVFVETVTNPLIEIPDLPKIIEIAHAAGIPVVVDNTMGTPVNCQPLKLGADIAIHSTSKYFSGRNHHGGGAILANDPGLAAEIEAVIDQFSWQMSPFEATLLAESLADFELRMARFNANGRAVADLLRSHPAVDHVYFPGDVPAEHLDHAGSVISFSLSDKDLDALVCFYESEMPGVLKAPSLGSDVTLLCPYTLLTYYHRDDDYLASIRLPRHLLRLAVGSELDIQPVLDSLMHTLNVVAPAID